MIQSKPYIVVPMEVMDKVIHALRVLGSDCPEHLKEDVNFALMRVQDTALYMHGDNNLNAKVKPAVYNFGIKDKKK